MVGPGRQQFSRLWLRTLLSSLDPRLSLSPLFNLNISSIAIIMMKERYVLLGLPDAIEYYLQLLECFCRLVGGLAADYIVFTCFLTGNLHKTIIFSSVMSLALSRN